MEKLSKKRQQKQQQKRAGLTVLTPELLEPNLTLPTNKLSSVSAFIREKKFQITRELQRRYYRAKKLGITVENCPLPDPIWRRYQHGGGVRIDNFDLNGCENDEMIFDLAKEIVEDVESAEIGPDSGIPVNSETILPRSFFLDSLHHAASLHCLHFQVKANKPTKRSECPSPVERSRALEGFSERYKSTLKTLVKRTKRSWEGRAKVSGKVKGIEKEKENLETVKDVDVDLDLDLDLDLDEVADLETDLDYSEIELDDEATDLECEFNESVSVNSTTTTTPLLTTPLLITPPLITPPPTTDNNNNYSKAKVTPNFEAILSRLLDTPEALNPVPASQNYANAHEYGADGLWSFDSSALLAFGIMAEEFIGRMVDAHLDGENENENDGEDKDKNENENENENENSV